MVEVLGRRKSWLAEKKKKRNIEVTTPQHKNIRLKGI